MDSDGCDDMLLEAPSTTCSPQHSLAESKQNFWNASRESGWSTAPTSPAEPSSQLNLNEAFRENSPSANEDCHVSISKSQLSANALRGAIEKGSSVVLSVAAAQTVGSTPVVCAVSDAPTLQDASPSIMRTPPDKAEVIRRLEVIFENITDTLLANTGKITITLRSRAVPPGPGFDHRHALTTNGSEGRAREICFPGSTSQEAWRFTVLVRILELVHEALSADVVITKRDIYYRHPALFVKQAVVDRYVDDIACAFGVPRLSLNVAAAAKGLVVGGFTCRRGDGTVLEGLSDREGLLIPNVNLTDRFRLSRVSWILVVEKEATFRSLASSNFWDTLVSSGIMITAKGYPDVATRTFLRAISTPSPQNGFRCAPVYALMDYDPDGIAIMSTYKYGSFALAHENTKLVVPQMGWLGIRSSVLPSCAAALTESSNHGNEDANGESNVHQVQGLLRLTTRDRRKALKMLEWDVFAENGPEPRWRMEFQVMLMLNVKAEIQIMEAQTGGLAGWLQAELNGL